jgi:hypothetical protein
VFYKNSAIAGEEVLLPYPTKILSFQTIVSPDPSKNIPSGN